MIKTIKNSFIVLKENIIIIQPLVIYMLLIGVLLKPLFFATSITLSAILLLICIFLSTTAFLAGWLYTVKVAIAQKDTVYNTPEEKSLASLSLLKQYFIGVGDYFIPITIAVLLYLALFAAFGFLAYKAGMHFIGKPEFDIATLKHLSTQSYNDVYTYFASEKFSDKRILSIYNWSLYFSFISLFFTIITIFWYPTIFYKTKNPIMAFFSNLKFTFINFFDTTIVVLFLAFLNVALSLVNALAPLNIIFSVISLLLMFFYMSYYIILVFLYYAEKTQDNSDNRS